MLVTIQYIISFWCSDPRFITFSFFSESGMNAMFLSLRRLYKQKLVFKFLLLRSYNLRECNYFSPSNSFFNRNSHVPDYQGWEIKSSCAFHLALWLLFLSWMYGFLFKRLDIMCSNSFSVPASSACHFLE